MKTHFILALLVSLFTLTVSAQTYEDVVYLKNGSIIHGMIIEHVPNVSLTIKSSENLFVYKLDEIAKYTREEVKGGGKGYGFKPKGFVANYEVGFTDFPKGTDLPMFSVMLVNGYQFSPYAMLGLGIGADISKQNVYCVPVVADFRAYFSATRVAPFINLAFGYNAFLVHSPGGTMQIPHSIGYYPYVYYTTETTAASTTALHGMVFNPGMGARIAINKKIGITARVGYKMLDAVSDGNHALMHGVNFMAGVVF